MDERLGLFERSTAHYSTNPDNRGRYSRHHFDRHREDRHREDRYRDDEYRDDRDWDNRYGPRQTRTARSVERPDINQKVSLEAQNELEKILHASDEGAIAKCNSDIDALLVFAGIFAAILATFSAQSLQLLADPTRKYGVRVNTIWFAALVCSLFTASGSILVKQCLREYLHLGRTSPQERLRVRHVRYLGLIRWKVFELAAALPILLQCALLLFLAGLSELLRALNFTVWLSTTALIAGWFIASFFALIAPFVSSSCPFKLPFLNPWMQSTRALLNRMLPGDTRRKGHQNQYYRFKGDENGVIRDRTLDSAVIISADKVLGDNNVLSQHIRHCVKSAKGEEVLAIVQGLLSNRLDRPISSLSDPLELDRIPSQALEVFAVLLLNAMEGRLNAPNISSHWFRESVSFLAAVLKHIQSRPRPLITIGSRCEMLFSNILARGSEGDMRHLFVTLLNHSLGDDILRAERLSSHFLDHPQRILSNLIGAAQTLCNYHQYDPSQVTILVFTILNALPSASLRQRREEVSRLASSLTHVLPRPDVPSPNGAYPYHPHQGRWEFSNWKVDRLVAMLNLKLPGAVPVRMSYAQYTPAIPSMSSRQGSPIEQPIIIDRSPPGQWQSVRAPTLSESPVTEIITYPPHAFTDPRAHTIDDEDSNAVGVGKSPREPPSTSRRSHIIKPIIVSHTFPPGPRPPSPVVNSVRSRVVRWQQQTSNLTASEASEVVPSQAPQSEMPSPPTPALYIPAPAPAPTPAPVSNTTLYTDPFPIPTDDSELIM